MNDVDPPKSKDAQQDDKASLRTYAFILTILLGFLMFIFMPHPFGCKGGGKSECGAVYALIIPCLYYALYGLFRLYRKIRSGRRF